MADDKRREYLKYILEEEYDSNRDKLAADLTIAKTTLNKYLSRGKSRPISDRTARQFEKRLGIPTRALDQTYNTVNTNIYYIQVNYAGSQADELLRSLKRFDIVKEACIQYGSSDVFIKIEATEQECQKVVLNAIRLFPGVTNTTTSQALNSARWQRNQVEYSRLPEKENTPHAVLQNYIETKRQELYEELQALEKGKRIIIQKNDYNTLNFYDLLEKSESNVKMIVFYNHKTHRQLEKELFDSRKKNKSNIHYQILLLTDDNFNQEFENKLKRFKNKLLEDKNTYVLHTNENTWIGDRRYGKGITLTIIDEYISSVLNGNSYTLSYKKEEVGKYCKLFNNNWSFIQYQNHFY